MKKAAFSPEIQDLADQIGRFMEYWGFKRVHGRIWTHLFLSEDPLDASDLMKRLAVSKALVSISLKDLLEYGVIQEVSTKSARGTQLYRPNPSVMEVILQVLRSRERRLIARIEGAHRLLRERPASELSEMKISPKNLKIMGDLIGKAADSLESILALERVDFGGFEPFRDPTPEARS